MTSGMPKPLPDASTAGAGPSTLGVWAGEGMGGNYGRWDRLANVGRNPHLHESNSGRQYFIRPR